MRPPSSSAGRRPLILVLVLVLAAAMALAGCAASSSATPTASTSPASAEPASAAAPSAAGQDAVTIADFAFSPASLTVKAGETVTWTNKDGATHTVTADDGSFDSKGLSPDATFSQAMAKAGTYTYHCSIHSSMTATIVVQ